jgi:hypothetical protein
MIVRLPGIAVIGIASLFFVVTLFVFSSTGALAAEDQGPQIEVELTESFYRALKADGMKTYSTNKSEEYLRQIAVSSRFAVESNLKIIKQQARIIELLEAIKSQNK